MTNEKIFHKIKNLLDVLEISDEDTRQEIYLKGLSEPHNCITNNDIYMNIINPVVYNLLNEEKNKKSIISTDFMENERGFRSKKEDDEKLKLIKEVSSSLGGLHSYLIDDYFLKEIPASDVANYLNIDSNELELLVEKVLKDIKRDIDNCMGLMNK